MSVFSRVYDPKKDYTAAMTFFRETFNQIDTYQVWSPTRFENAIFGIEEKNENIKLWYRTEKSQELGIVGVAIIDDNVGELITHRDYRYLEKEMLQWCEKRIEEKYKRDNEKTKIFMSCVEKDERKKAMLIKRGYKRFELAEQIRIKQTKTIPDKDLSEAYYIKPFDAETYKYHIDAVKEVFGHNFFTEEVYRTMREEASFYVPKLDLGLYTNEGELAAFTMVRIDPKSKIAEFEPVATLPGHRRKGLASAIIIEGMKRAKKTCDPACYYIIAATTEEASKFYDSLGFTKKTDVYYWIKEI